MNQLQFYKIVVDKKWEIVKDFCNDDELRAWCLDHHPNAKRIEYQELN